MNDITKLWPHQEAKRILERWPQKSKYILQTGFGASGHPHMGTIGEIVRTFYVATALKDFGKESDIIVFSDDLDGLRKIPLNIDAPWLADHLGKPVTMIPDPYGTAASFGHHMDEELVQMLKATGIAAEFRSATDCYRDGTFDDGIRLMFKNMKAIIDLVLPTMRAENREGWFPWLPICENCGKVYTTKVHDYDPGEATVTYSCTGQFRDVTGCGHQGTQSALGGRGKFFWKADWALRWHVFNVNFEMHGKDLIDSAKQSSEIVKAIGGKPPVTMVYELFLTEEGRKISKSTGAGISTANWGRWGTQDSMNLLMFKNPKQQKNLGTDSVIQYTDETLIMPKEDPQYRFIYYHGDRPDLGGLKYSDLINLVNAVSVTDKDQLIEYLGRSFGRERIDANEQFVRDLLTKALNYYEDFILPTREIPTLTAEEWEMVDEFDRLIDTIDAPDEIQTGVFSIAKARGYQPKNFFRVLYGVLLGAESGPRVGGFVQLVGKARIHELIEAAKAKA